MRYTLDKSNVRDSLFNVLDNGQPTKAFAAEHVTFSDHCEVTAGVFRGGVFRGGEFRGGVFHGGEFHGGVFHDGWLPSQIQGSRHFVNIPDGKTIAIGCQVHTPEYWIENFETIGIDHGYTPEQIVEYKCYIDLAAEMIRAAS
jgi:hypothetical protein